MNSKNKSLDKSRSRLRLARAVIGIGFLLFAGTLPNFTDKRLVRPISALAVWFGLSHLVAAASGYDGCPELGAIPSLILRRPLPVACAIWERLDSRINRI